MSLTDEVLICPQCREALTYGSDNPDLLQQMIREQLKIRVGDQGKIR